VTQIERSKMHGRFTAERYFVLLVPVALDCSVLMLVLVVELLLLDSRRILRRPEARARSRTWR
jgi:hypothetical protein